MNSVTVPGLLEVEVISAEVFGGGVDDVVGVVVLVFGGGVVVEVSDVDVVEVEVEDDDVDDEEEEDEEEVDNEELELDVSLEVEKGGNKSRR